MFDGSEIRGSEFFERGAFQSHLIRFLMFPQPDVFLMFHSSEASGSDFRCFRSLRVIFLMSHLPKASGSDFRFFGSQGVDFRCVQHWNSRS